MLQKLYFAWAAVALKARARIEKRMRRIAICLQTTKRMGANSAETEVRIKR